MSDQTNESAIDEPMAPTGPAAEPHGASGNPAGAAADPTDWKAMARKWEKQAKENRAAADELAKLKEASMTEQELAAKKAEETEAQLREARRRLSVYEAAKTAGVDAELLERMRGDTPEEIAANAEFVKASLGNAPKYPAVIDNGAPAPAPAKRAEVPQLI